jgi:hypothetical protein
MCYPKPGPRCSSHAAARLTLAKRAMKHGDKSDREVYLKNKALCVEAEKEYDMTPAGMKELQRRIRDSRNRQQKDFQLRLEQASALRKASLAALKAKDQGDIKHDTPDKKPITDYLTSEFPKHGTDREKLQHFDPKVDAMIEESKQWSENLNADEMEALAWFTSNGSGSVNTFLAENSTKSGPFIYTKKTLNKTRVNLDSALAKFKREEPILIYRGINDSIFKDENNDSLSAEQIIEGNFQKGMIYKSPAFMSASLDPAKGSGFAITGITLEILSKKAAPIVNFSAWDVSEKEMLIPRNQEYKVHQVLKNPTFAGRKREGDYIIQLVEV